MSKPAIPLTLQRFLLNRLEDHPERLSLVMMMADLATIGKLISAQTNRAGLSGIRGLTDSTNVQDETQANLDVYANELCKTYLETTGLFAALASEEEEAVVDLQNPEAQYVIAFDPLDGSSNIDVNVSIGTIFSVHKRLGDVPAADEKQFLQPAKDQVLAGYILYGSSTVLVFSWGDGVHEFTLDVDLGEFILSDQAMQLPDKAAYYSLNEAYVPLMSDKDKNYLAELKKRIDKQRWIGSFVADFHRNLIKGGVFFFPSIGASPNDRKPKLRLNYEVKPMAFLIDQAGGAATTGEADIMTLKPIDLHQRIPIIIGNIDIVKLY